LLTRRGFAARAALIAALVISLAGCARRTLSTSELRGVTEEVVAAAQRVTGRKSQIAIRPEFEPSWFGFGGRGRLVADDLDISVQNPSDVSALAQALAQIARRHRLSFSETPSGGETRFDFTFHGNRTHSILVNSAAGAGSRAPVEGSGSPRLAIIIDDLGGDRAAADAVLALPFPFTASVMPNLPYSAYAADRAYRNGDHVILHLPMEAQPGSAGGQPEAVELRVGMNENEVKSTLAEMLATVPHAAGANNHEGSRATADPALMNELMAALHERGLYFIDSRTTAATVAYDSAESAGVPAASRKVFLDDTATREAVLAQLDLAARDARRDGYAIAIGHPHPPTIAALAEDVPRLRAEGIRLVFASDLVH
jgi:uncharacterized protein